MEGVCVDCQLLNPLLSRPRRSLHRPWAWGASTLSPPSAACLRRHQALEAFLGWVLGPRMRPADRPRGGRCGFPDGPRKRHVDPLADDALSSSGFLSVPIVFSVLHMANIVTRRGLCLGKAKVRLAGVQGQGSAMQCSAQSSWGLCRKSPLVWWVPSLQGTELQAVLGV